MLENNEKLRTKIITGVFIGAFVFLLFILLGDINLIIETISKIHPIYLLATIVISFLGYYLRFLKWSYLLNTVGIHVPQRDSFNIYWIGRAMSITPGKVGELIKIHSLKKLNKTELSKSSPVILSEWITDLFGILLIMSLGITLFSFGVVLFFTVFLGLTITLFILQRPKLSISIIEFLCKVKWVEKRKESIIQFYGNTQDLFKFKPLAISILLSALAWLTDCISLYIFTKSLGLDLSLLHNLFIFSFGTLAGAVSMLPGGMGVSEISMTGLFLSFGVEKSLAISLTLLIRVITLWLGVAIGIIVFFKKKTKYI
ncbi:lysylphosphatidylglycerol synthase transmembrane domain-containing protein [Paenibacillus agilis]|uniref:Phosphatidylglycerol lysyltransferase n=1 Tax=Paenibacillus agilis TaxID=3020863 RepID=A0A559IP55_9BACL|nr:lysylphosphatidylglycerol synthase transmembrane domain-containing protein [Paenibacillus agilis]TVX89405.1 flippase-like domain-containing protein [Paenibacillus agilis]